MLTKLHWCKLSSSLVAYTDHSRHYFEFLASRRLVANRVASKGAGEEAWLGAGDVTNLSTK